jgi:hypothetical protein
MKTLPLIIFFLLVGCGPVKQTHPDFIKYINSFETELNLKVKTTIVYKSIVLSEEELKKSRSVGTCYRYANSNKNFIDIEKQYWDAASEAVKEQLIFHELGHCELNLDHTEEKISTPFGSIPKSIMFPYVFGNQMYYQVYKNYYVEELKDKNYPFNI